MKKIAISLLAALYLGTSPGATIQLHYCMDRLIGWEVSHEDTSKCSKNDMEKKDHKGCCKDENRQIKNDTDQKVSESFTQLSDITSEIAKICSSACSFALPNIIPNKFTKANSPPRSCHTSINIVNCVFLI
jgi:hypothetical protein